MLNTHFEDTILLAALAVTKFTICIPEVSWVGLLLEGIEGFPSPFESFRTILRY